jgi:murein L,D-transpeptidase YcbB/YkuD
MKRRIIFLILCLLMLPLAATAHGGAADPFIEQHIKKIETDQKYRISRERIMATGILPILYRDNQLQLLWQNRNGVNQLFKAIEESEKEGLTPTDYHQQSLQRLAKEIAAGMDYPSLQADFDILLSDALVRLAYDKSYGKVDPAQLDPDWNLPEKNIGQQLAGRVELAIRKGTVAKSLAGLSPQVQLYLDLEKSLAKYRAIKAAGGWQPIPDGSVLKPGMEDSRIPALRKRLLSNEEMAAADPASLLFDDQLKEAVIRFQKNHYLEGDGILGKHSLATLNQTVDEKIDQIRVNLERARWILHDLPDRFILVDIAGYTLSVYDHGKVSWQTKVVVGKPFHETPVFRADMKYLVINPTWTLPRSIIVNETLAKIKKDPSYLAKENLRIMDNRGNTINPASINWQTVTGRTFPYGIRQDPGPDNALGRIKFIFPNSHSVYLHDTPSRSLFGRDQRAFSHGCIRVYKPLTLGEVLLRQDGQDWDEARIQSVIDAAKITKVKLNSPLPVMLLYWTVHIVDGNVMFKQDIYGRDKQLLKALDGPFRFRSSVVKQLDAQLDEGAGLEKME